MPSSARFLLMSAQYFASSFAFDNALFNSLLSLASLSLSIAFPINGISAIASLKLKKESCIPLKAFLILVFIIDIDTPAVSFISEKNAPVALLRNVNAFKIPVNACTKNLDILLKTPCPSSNDNKKPSQAEPNSLVSPSKLSSRMSAIAFAAPPEFSKVVVNLPIASSLLAKFKRDFAPISPTNS